MGDMAETSGRRAKVPGKRSSFACADCRRRKSRCDGAYPACRSCSIYDETCRYEQAPSLRHVRALEVRVCDLEAFVRSLASAPLPARRDEMLMSAVQGDGEIRVDTGPLFPTTATPSATSTTAVGHAQELSVSSAGEISHHNLTSFYALPSPGSTRSRYTRAGLHRAVRARRRIIAARDVGQDPAGS